MNLIAESSGISHKNAWLTVRKGRAQSILAIIALTFAREIGMDYVLLV